MPLSPPPVIGVYNFGRTYGAPEYTAAGRVRFFRRRTRNVNATIRLSRNNSANRVPVFVIHSYVRGRKRDAVCFVFRPVKETRERKLKLPFNVYTRALEFNFQFIKVPVRRIYITRIRTFYGTLNTTRA